MSYLTEIIHILLDAESNGCGGLVQKQQLETVMTADGDDESSSGNDRRRSRNVQTPPTPAMGVEASLRVVMSFAINDRIEQEVKF